MWLFTSDGFFSVVQKPQDRKKGTLTIRTRNRADMDTLVSDYFPDAEPYRVKYSDYEWRIRVPKGEWAKAVSQMAMNIDYSNFKDEVTRRQGWDRHDVYLKVWRALLAISDRPRKGWRYRDDEFEPEFTRGKKRPASSRP
jgi:hypothetical protein